MSNHIPIRNSFQIFNLLPSTLYLFGPHWRCIYACTRARFPGISAKEVSGHKGWVHLLQSSSKSPFEQRTQSYQSSSALKRAHCYQCNRYNQIWWFTKTQAVWMEYGEDPSLTRNNFKCSTYYLMKPPLRCLRVVTGYLPYLFCLTSGICKLVGLFSSMSKPRPSTFLALQNNIW